MKKLLVFAVLGLLYLLGCSDSFAEQFRDGDIIFQTSRSEQSIAIQKATRSQYSHMGIVFLRNGSPHVYEAIKTVQYTPLRKWVDRGEGGRQECGELLGGERTGGEWDGGIKEDGCDTASGESGGKARGEEHRGETSQTQGVLESYIFMDVPLSQAHPYAFYKKGWLRLSRDVHTGRARLPGT